MHKRNINNVSVGIAMIILSIVTLYGCSDKSTVEHVDNSNGAKTVCVAQYISHPALDQAYSGFMEEFLRMGYRLDQIIYKNASGDANSARLLADQFCADKCAAIFALATPMAQKIKSTCPKKPLVFGAITDPISAGLVSSMEKPNGNSTGTSDQWPYALQMEMIAYLWGANTSVGVPFNPSEANTTYAIKEIKKYSAQYQLNFEGVPINNSNEALQSVDALKGRVSVIYIPADNTAMAAAKGIITNAHRLGILVVAGDPGTFEAGADIGLGVSYKELGKQNARQVAQVFSGAKVGLIPVGVSNKPTLFINHERLNNSEFKLKLNSWIEKYGSHFQIN